MKNDNQASAANKVRDAHFWWPCFGFLSVCAITAGVTLVHIYGPVTPVEELDPVAFCLKNPKAETRCEAFFESGIALEYMENHTGKGEL